ncbi:hypothetical protein [Halobacillus naozhouensis]|uniref:DUF3137 domain-containing protein n=1 Tax=Halobacillus naozhouensis TaxID=554880 RepID=A0ABY8J420_9BACI|nr:hypothetical protein [Halobacillus naozhouensis]WFT75500.1 hypothetical protein P9989_03635 [Halobacillus naozhouensis]
MIAEMYKRRENLAYVLLVVVTLVVAGYLVLERPESTSGWVEASTFLVPLGFMLAVAITSRQKYNKVKGLSIPYSTTSILEIDHLVLKQDAGLIPRLLCFGKNGYFVGTYKPIHLPWYLYPVLIYKRSLLTMLPVTIAFISHTGETLFTLKRVGFKESVIAVYDQESQYLGRYVQEDFKSLLHIKGELRDCNEELILPVKASGFSGDFTLKDINDHRWAHFFNGRFPHEYTQIFRDIDNDIVEISNDVSQEHKMLLLGMIGYLFIARNNR